MRKRLIRVVTNEDANSGGRRVRRRSFGRFAGRKQRVPRGLAQYNVHHFKRSVQSYWPMNLQTGFNLGAYDMEFSFALAGVNNYIGGGFISTSAMPDVTDFTNLYDQYRIDKVHMRFGFTNNSSGVNTPTTELPILKIATDYDDVAATTSSQILQYAGMKCFQVGNQGKSQDGWYDYWVTPMPQVTTYRTAVASGYSRPDKPIKIDTQYPDVPHYAVKLFWDNYGLNNPVIVGNLVIITTYYVTMLHSK